MLKSPFSHGFPNALMVFSAGDARCRQVLKEAVAHESQGSHAQPGGLLPWISSISSGRN